MGLRYYREILPTLKELGTIRGDNLIEYGCGPGRFTARLSHGWSILAIDFSHCSLALLAEKLNDYSNCGLVLADASYFVTRPGFFQAAMALQLLEHIPTREKRRQFLRNLTNSLVPGGTFVCSVYHHSIKHRFRGEPAEGYHPSGIFYHRFSKQEIKREFDGIFTLLKVTIIDIKRPFEARINLPSIVERMLNWSLRHLPLVKYFGRLILVKAKSNRGAGR